VPPPEADGVEGEVEGATAGRASGYAEGGAEETETVTAGCTVAVGIEAGAEITAVGAGAESVQALALRSIRTLSVTAGCAVAVGNITFGRFQALALKPSERAPVAWTSGTAAGALTTAPAFAASATVMAPEVNGLELAGLTVIGAAASGAHDSDRVPTLILWYPGGHS